MPLPWTSDAANKLSNMGRQDSASPKTQPVAIATKPLTPEEMKRLKANLFKPIKTEPKNKQNSAPDLSNELPAEAKKKRFGIF